MGMEKEKRQIVKTKEGTKSMVWRIETTKYLHNRQRLTRPLRLITAPRFEAELSANLF
jgi:hypothetical protein